MNNQLQVIENNTVKKYEDKEFISTIKEVFAKELKEQEFQLFLEIGKATGLNPFLREIWAVKYGTAPASIFVGRDGYRKGAQRHPAYDYHNVEAIYSNDIFEVKDGIYTHQFNIKDRGILRGAYCNVFRKDASKPFSVFIPIEEYNKNTQIWKTMPSTMIKKVAEAQCLRMAFQDLFGGTYSEAEDWKEERTENKNVIDVVNVEKIPQKYSNVMKERQEKGQKLFTFLEEFESKKSDFMLNIDAYCVKLLGIQEIDSIFENTFHTEFLGRLKDEFVKNEGKINFDELFVKFLALKRITVLINNYNATRSEKLTNQEIDNLKREVGTEFMKDTQQNIVDLFNRVTF